jgi:lysylphosphatidylglycerol synthase-like protein
LPRIGLALRLVSGVELPKNPTSCAAGESARSREPNQHLMRKILGWAFAIVSLAWVFHDIHIERLSDHVRAINWWWVLAAVLCDIGSYGFEGLRWERLLHSLGRLPLARAIQAIYAGLFVNAVRRCEWVAWFRST